MAAFVSWALDSGETREQDYDRLGEIRTSNASESDNVGSGGPWWSDDSERDVALSATSPLSGCDGVTTIETQ